MGLVKNEIEQITLWIFSKQRVVTGIIGCNLTDLERSLLIVVVDLVLLTWDKTLAILEPGQL